MYSNKTISATFAINTYTLTVNATNGAVTKVPNQVSYDSGTVVQLTGVPATGYHFVNWTGDLTGTKNPDTVMLSRNKTITANFAINTYTLTTSVLGSGSVTKTPNQSLYNHGTSVKLTAIPALGYQFVKWSGDLTETTNPATIIMDRNKAVIANFVINASGGLSLRDNFNAQATRSINGRYKWKQLTNNDAGSGSIQINSDSTISPYNRNINSSGGIVWDSLLTDGTQIGLIFKGGKGNSAQFFMYFRMTGKDLNTSDGYTLSYFDDPVGNDRIMLERVTNGKNRTTLKTFSREMTIGDTLVAKVEPNKTMKVLVYGINGIRDSISAVDNTYNPSKWYAWIRGLVVNVPVKMDNFMIGPALQQASSLSKQGIVNEITLQNEYSLELAYPNPFNPNTTIRYNLPIDSRVTLRVYNTQGQIVTILSNEIQQAGFKSATWNANGVSSGVYFYRLEATSVSDPSKSFTQVKKMLLLK
jgi:uncharacterized repeat protein (TIGR02543 family)